jgi:hypothetical protein
MIALFGRGGRMTDCKLNIYVANSPESLASKSYMGFSQFVMSPDNSDMADQASIQIFE